MSNLHIEYFKAKDKFLESLGLETDYVECPIDNCLDFYWYLTDTEDGVYYAETEEILLQISNGECEEDYYYDDIYTQRFYSKYVYQNEECTLIFCDPHVDGCKWWKVFDNSKKRNLNFE